MAVPKSSVGIVPRKLVGVRRVTHEQRKSALAKAGVMHAFGSSDQSLQRTGLLIVANT